MVISFTQYCNVDPIHPFCDENCLSNKCKHFESIPLPVDITKYGRAKILQELNELRHAAALGIYYATINRKAAKMNQLVIN